MTGSSFAARKLAPVKREWEKFRRLPAGQRFELHYEAAQRKARTKPGWQRWLKLLLIPLFTAIGVVLMFIPGPAILFYLLAAGLLAAQSRRIARTFDRLELRLRAGWTKLRNWRNSHSRKEKPPLHRTGGGY